MTENNAFFQNRAPTQAPSKEADEAKVLLGMLQDFQRLAPDVPEFTLLMKGTTRQPVSRDALHMYLLGLSQQLGMAVTIQPESWEAQADGGKVTGLMAAVGLDNSSPLVNVWTAAEGKTVFKVNIDSRAPFCWAGVTDYTRRWFGADQLVCLPL